MSDIIRNETAHTINGVSGRLCTLRRPPAPWKAGTFGAQTWRSESRFVKGFGTNGKMAVDIRFDDNCKNGHNTFAITADVVTVESRRQNDIAAGGCMHDEILQIFPELAPLIKWHLCSTDGPMHYVANTVYHASDLDYNGRAKGEASAWSYGYRFDDVPMIHIVKPSFFKWIEARRAFNNSTPKSNPAHGEFIVTAIAHVERPTSNGYKFGPKFTFVGFGQQWHDCPFDDEATAQSMAQALNRCRVYPERVPTAYSEGKERDLEAARRCAVWPEATDAQLCLPKAELTALLAERLPGLLATMRADIEAAGFVWECPAN